MRKTSALFGLLATLVLSSCSASFRYSPYVYGPLETSPIGGETGQGYARPASYPSLSSADIPSIPSSLPGIYSIGPGHRKLLPTTGKQNLTVIPVDFVDAPMEAVGDKVVEQLQESFFGDGAFNQYVSLAEYYDKSSFHRLQVVGEVTPRAFRSTQSYATLKNLTSAVQTKAALTQIYNEAITWYNASEFKTRDLVSGDAVYFVYCAPYSGMDGGSTTRSSMMWAFTINDPAPICWSSYYMSHPRDDGSMDAHTFIHEFGHMLGLKDYYDPNSYIELSPVSPLGRMDMMDCSLGDHNAFSKCILGWEAPMVVNGEAEIALRPSQGNGDCVLLPLSTSNGTLFDEYLLLEYYSPTYLNYADASLRGEMGMTLMGKTGIKAYHVDARIGLYDNRSKAPKAYLTPNVNVGTHSLDFYCENSGTSSRGTAYSSRGFLIQSINVSSSSLALPENFIASDHDEDIPYGNTVARLRNVLFQVGQGINANTKDMTFHTGGALRYGFEVTAVTPGYAKIRTFSL